MNHHDFKPVGYCCAYTPPFLIAAAGFTPYRVLPVGNVADQAGQLMHDNVCPHVKRVLDRAMGGDLPELEGMIFINSCDSMRRLSDAWKASRPNDRLIILELPSTTDERSIRFLGDEYDRLYQTLAKWNASGFSEEAVLESIHIHNVLVKKMNILHEFIQKGKIDGSFRDLQEIYNFTSTHSAEDSIKKMNLLLEKEAKRPKPTEQIPIFLSGNVLPNIEAFKLFEESGAKIVAHDLCTGSRMFSQVTVSASEPLFRSIARSILTSPPCARTFDASNPGAIAQMVLERARAAGAKGVILHTMKFCDPYLARIPYIREHLREAFMPFLVIEGDCTMGSMGQHQTRIEAFIEMLR